jgi:hypothetical protein
MEPNVSIQSWKLFIEMIIVTFQHHFNQFFCGGDDISYHCVMVMVHFDFGQKKL